MQDKEKQAHAKTDAMIDEMEKHLQTIYKTAQKEMQDKWDKYMQDVEKETASLQAALDEAVKSGDAEAIKKAQTKLKNAKYEALQSNKYYKDMVKEMSQQYTHANETAVRYINDQMADVYALNYNATGKKIADMQSGYSFNLVDRNTVKQLAKDDGLLLPHKTVNVSKDEKWNIKAINSQMLQGIIQGEDIQKIANRLGNVTLMEHSAAVRNARTMTTAAENRGRTDSRKTAEDMGIVIQQRWMCTHDARTRDTHIEADGQMVDVGNYFRVGNSLLLYPGDPDGEPQEVYNCRCTTVSEVLGFKKA